MASRVALICVARAPPRHPGAWDNEGQTDSSTGAALARQQGPEEALTPARGFVAPWMTGTPASYSPCSCPFLLPPPRSDSAQRYSALAVSGSSSTTRATVFPAGTRHFQGLSAPLTLA